MSTATIRKLLQERLASISPSLPTAYDNAVMKESVGTSYQEVNLIPAGVEDPVFGVPGGSSLRRDIGLMQVTLCYPEGAGSGAAEARAEAVRSQFPRGLVLTDGSIRLRIEKSPVIHQGRPDRGFYRTPVSVFYTADVQT